MASGKKRFVHFQFLLSFRQHDECLRRFCNIYSINDHCWINIKHSLFNCCSTKDSLQQTVVKRATFPCYSSPIYFIKISFGMNEKVKSAHIIYCCLFICKFSWLPEQQSATRRQRSDTISSFKIQMLR